MIRPILSTSVVALIAACATTPELEPINDEAFAQASLVIETEPRPVEIVETVKPLPLPGQMKRIETNTEIDSVHPREAIAQAGKAR